MQNGLILTTRSSLRRYPLRASLKAVRLSGCKSR
nr:MAG TPA: hypothetical protein [Caudoviricetes sp.]DAJ29671.1 MAG TPA: hypothetical protein [Caudoviricetes sp.]